jgi:hypothetical protein
MRQLLLLSISLAIALSAGCATSKVADNRVYTIWEQIRAEFPHNRVEMPKVVWVDRNIFIKYDDKETFVHGAYLVSTNTVYLREWWADEKTVEHEFRHAHGDTQGETPGTLLLR